MSAWIIPVIHPEIDPMHLVLGGKCHELDQRVLLVAAAGRAIGEACGDLALPALLGILEVRGRIHERFEGCRQATHVSGRSHDDGVCTIEKLPSARRLFCCNKLHARAIDGCCATRDCLGDLHGVTISAVIDDDDFHWN
jgi:hypothetical protein